ncbi:MAG: hypothetical protein WA667_22425 [Candidatus Nitrosopolaris sp.]
MAKNRDIELGVKRNIGKPTGIGILQQRLPEIFESLGIGQFREDDV